MVEVFRESFDDDSGFTKSQAFFSDGLTDYLGITDGASAHDFDLLAGETAPVSQATYTGFTGSFLTGSNIDDSDTAVRAGLDQSVVMFDWTGIDISNLTNLSFTGLFAGGQSADVDAVYELPSIMRIEVQIDGTGYQQVLDIRQDDIDGSNGVWRVDTDGDNDGILDGDDNCPIKYNPDQIDNDGDGQGMICDGTELAQLQGFMEAVNLDIFVQHTDLLKPLVFPIFPCKAGATCC